MVCLPDISCNGTCFVHEIFRLDAIERYIVTIYQRKMVSQSKFSVTLPRVWICIAHNWVCLSPDGVVLNPEGFVLSPEGDVLNPEGFTLPHFWDYLPPEEVVLLSDGN